MNSFFEDVVTKVIDEITPVNLDRNWVMDYLYKYKFGDKFPRGDFFKIFKQIESPSKFNRLVSECNWELNGLIESNRVSPHLLRQKAFLTWATIHSVIEFDMDSVFEVIKLLEGGLVKSSARLIKHKLAFSKKGALSGYEHHHVPLLPNSYFKMLGAKKKHSNEWINIGTIMANLDQAAGTLDMEAIENAIESRGARKGGRLTGHWLITKKIDGERYYLGIFPHGHESYDDAWIKVQLAESERLLKINR